MGCSCSEYVACGQTVEAGYISDSFNVLQHSYTRDETITDLPYTFGRRVVRKFYVSYTWDRAVHISHVIDCGHGRFGCGGTSLSNPSSGCKEECEVEINTLFYADHYRQLYVWKNVKETLNFDVNSNKTAAFRMKFGNGYFHKICILNTTKTKGSEKFIVSKGGIQTILAESTYEYNPFPFTEGGGATWGLYGNVIQREAVPDTPNVACILLFPLVPKQAIPLDNDVIAYGFYDYNSIEGGFIETSLPQDDGGKDYFYPYWLRNMPLDPLWRSTADTRYDVIYSLGKMDLSGKTNWVPSIPNEYPWPFGSFALDSLGNFVISCLLQFSSRSNDGGVVVNYTNFGDLYSAITKHKVPYDKKFGTFYPVTPI